MDNPKRIKIDSVEESVVHLSRKKHSKRKKRSKRRLLKLKSQLKDCFVKLTPLSRQIVELYEPKLENVDDQDASSEEFEIQELFAECDLKYEIMKKDAEIKTLNILLDNEKLKYETLVKVSNKNKLKKSLLIEKLKDEIETLNQISDALVETIEELKDENKRLRQTIIDSNHTKAKNNVSKSQLTNSNAENLLVKFDSFESLRQYLNEKNSGSSLEPPVQVKSEPPDELDAAPPLPVIDVKVEEDMDSSEFDCNSQEDIKPVFIREQFTFPSIDSFQVDKIIVPLCVTKQEANVQEQEKSTDRLESVEEDSEGSDDDIPSNLALSANKTTYCSKLTNTFAPSSSCSFESCIYASSSEQIAVNDESSIITKPFESKSSNTTNAQPCSTLSTSKAKPCSTQNTSNAKPCSTQNTSIVQPCSKQKTSNAKPSSTQNTSNVQPGSTQKTSNAKPSSTQKTSNAKPSSTQKTSNAKPSSTRSTSKAKPSSAQRTSNAKTSSTRNTSKAKTSSTRNTSKAKPSSTRNTSKAKPSSTRNTSNAKPSSRRNTSKAKPCSTQNTSMAEAEPCSTQNTSMAEAEPCSTQNTSMAEAEPSSTQNTSKSEPCSTLNTLVVEPCSTLNSSVVEPCSTQNTLNAKPSSTINTSNAEPNDELCFTISTSNADPCITISTSNADPCSTINIANAEPGSNINNANAEPGSNINNANAEPGSNINNANAEPGSTINNANAEPGSTINNANAETCSTINNANAKRCSTPDNDLTQPNSILNHNSSDSEVPLTSNTSETFCTSTDNVSSSSKHNCTSVPLTLDPNVLPIIKEHSYFSNVQSKTIGQNQSTTSKANPFEITRVQIKDGKIVSQTTSRPLEYSAIAQSLSKGSIDSIQVKDGDIVVVPVPSVSKSNGGLMPTFPGFLALKNLRLLYQCDTCPYSSIKQSKFLEHLEQHVHAERYECQFCLNKFKEKNIFLDHQREHYERVFKCDLCSYIGNESNLIKHRRLIHTPETGLAQYLEILENLEKSDNLKMGRKSQGILKVSAKSGERPFISDECRLSFDQEREHTELVNEEIVDDPS